jgi:AcrR family transcriptional regulator
MARVATKAAQNGQKRHKAKVRQRRVRHSAAVGKENSAATRAGARAQASAARREAILAAALDEFSARGFAATRLDDVARRAEVAKGTIYLHFADKETLFQELIRLELSPVVGALENASHVDAPIGRLTDQLAEVFVREIFETRRKDVIRLVLTEGPRFPNLAEFYYREIITRVMTAIRAMLRRAIKRGELKHEALVRFPQLLAAPGIVAILWNGLFDRFEPLDVRSLMRANFELLLGRAGAS